MKQDYRVQPIKGMKEKGMFRKQEWISEANNHLLSSKTLNDIARSSKKTLDLKIRQPNDPEISSSNEEVGDLICKVESYKKSSILLIGYAVEMYLKAGLVQLHQYTNREDFYYLLRRKYGHNLKGVAKLLGIELSEDEEKAIDRLKNLVLDEARYPITPLSEVDYTSQANKLSQEIWSAESYQNWIGLTEKISSYVKKIDSDSSNPASYDRFDINQDGYCVLRYGGNLPSYLLVKYSTEQIDAGRNTDSNLFDLLLAKLPLSISRSIIDQYRDEIAVIDLSKEAGKRKCLSSCRQRKQQPA